MATQLDNWISRLGICNEKNISTGNKKHTLQKFGRTQSYDNLPITASLSPEIRLNFEPLHITPLLDGGRIKHGAHTIDYYHKLSHFLTIRIGFILVYLPFTCSLIPTIVAVLRITSWMFYIA